MSNNGYEKLANVLGYDAKAIPELKECIARIRRANRNPRRAAQQMDVIKFLFGLDTPKLTVQQVADKKELWSNRSVTRNRVNQVRKAALRHLLSCLSGNKERREYWNLK